MANKWSKERRAKFARTVALKNANFARTTTVKNANKKINATIPLEAIPERPVRVAVKRVEPRATDRLGLAMAVVQLLREILR